MLEEAILALGLRDDGLYVDATAGAGGHSAAILQRLDSNGRLIAIDRDVSSIRAVQQRFGSDPRVKTFHSPFSQLGLLVEGLGLVGQVDGILLDLGVSSMQLDQPERGFSFMRSGSLWLIKLHRRDPQIQQNSIVARAILERHSVEPLKNTLELAELVARANPRHERNKHPATRTFQALRIALNDELGELNRLLAQVIGLLATGGRLVVISFHSLEDRMVKQFIQEHSEVGRGVPLDLPVREVSVVPPLRRVKIDKKPSPAEVQSNPRSRSAIMRVAQRTDAAVGSSDSSGSTRVHPRHKPVPAKHNLMVGAEA